tara:strand:- start:132 stop:368 length:237 start_codon:yes stop_codon:yes gene_type:complete
MNNDKIQGKMYGLLQIDNIQEAVKNVPAKTEKSEQYGHQLKVKATRWVDGNITIDLWDPENKKAYKIGMLREDKQDLF